MEDKSVIRDLFGSADQLVILIFLMYEGMSSWMRVRAQFDSCVYSALLNTVSSRSKIFSLDGVILVG
jgi:hypothetical protein